MINLILVLIVLLDVANVMNAKKKPTPLPCYVMLKGKKVEEVKKENRSMGTTAQAKAHPATTSPLQNINFQSS